MTQKKAREIIQSIPSLYPLKDFEEEAILTLLSEDECVIKEDGEDDRAEFEHYCPNCFERIWSDTDRFCRICGKALKNNQ